MDELKFMSRVFLLSINCARLTVFFGFFFLKGGLFSCMDRVPQTQHIAPDDEDVLEKENLVKAQRKEGNFLFNLSLAD